MTVSNSQDEASLARCGRSTEEQLRFLSLLLNAVEQAVIATDRTGRIVHWNGFAERLYGWHPDEVIGNNIVDVLLPKAARDLGRAAVSGLPRGERTAGNWTLLRRDGTTIPVRVLSTPILDDVGNAVGIVGVSWDISEKNRLKEELHQSESRLRLFAEQLPALAWATDVDLKMVWTDGAAYRLLETDPGSFVGMAVDLMVPEDAGQAEVVEAHRRALRGETVTYERAFKGAVLQCVVQPFRDPAGRTAGVVGVGLDITDRKRVEGELREKREQLQTLSRRLLTAHEEEQRALARELHDDFGQLLTAIRLNMEAARRGLSGDRAQHLAEGIALVDQATEQIRSLAIDLRPAILDDLGLVAAVRSLLKRQSQRAGFDGRLTVLRLETRLSAAVETCSFRLVQEALTNVVRHAAASHVDVELDAIDGELHIVVRDDGKGFDVSVARRRAARGESLGLMSMQERVTLAGGRLAISSTAGRGTTIDARMPLAGGGNS
jgi:PAS domain S-box-containing protein